MKRLMLILGVGALLLATPACSSGELSAQAVSLTTANPAQAHTVAAAENLYIIVGRTATGYVRSGKASPAAARKIGDYDTEVFNALKAARTAAQTGNSPAVAAALASWNARYGDLARYLASLGVPVPRQ